MGFCHFYHCVHDRTWFCTFGVSLNSQFFLPRVKGRIPFSPRFLDGQFAEILDKELHKSEALGWMGTFMKQGIAAITQMVKSAMRFSTEEYRKGICL